MGGAQGTQREGCGCGGINRGKETYGAIFFRVDAEVNTESRTVLLKNIKIDRIIITDLKGSKEKKVKKIIKNSLP